MHIDTKTNLLMRLLVTASSAHRSARSFWNATVHTSQPKAMVDHRETSTGGGLWSGLTEELLVQILLVALGSEEEEKRSHMIGQTAAGLRMAAMAGRMACTSRLWGAAAASDTIWVALFQSRWGSGKLPSLPSESQASSGPVLQAAYRQRHCEVKVP